MPNLINTDNAGNVFFNYITPVIKGETPSSYTSMLNSFFTQKLGAINTNWATNGAASYWFRLPAPGLEMKTGAVSAQGDNDARFVINNSRSGRGGVNTSNIVGTAGFWTGNISVGDAGDTGFASTAAQFAVINDYAFCVAEFNEGLASLRFFQYFGWLREPVYTGTSVGVLGLVQINANATGVTTARRVRTINTTTTSAISIAADSITSPPIVCTAGTDPGDGSETFTDVVIRDAAAPNNPVGKLWNCIDMPASCNVGELWRNTGAHDGDASASEQDTYLCIMPWGTRKLGMRIWTENVF